MKRFKSCRAYGAFEYAIVIALVIVSAIFVLNAVKGKANNDSAIDKSLTAVDSVFSEEGWLVSSPSVPVIPSVPTITFPDPGDRPKIDANGEMTEQKIKDYLTSNNVEIKDIDGNPATNYTIENIVKVEGFVQFDVVVGGDRGGRIEKVMIPSFPFANSYSLNNVSQSFIDRYQYIFIHSEDSRAYGTNSLDGFMVSNGIVYVKGPSGQFFFSNNTFEDISADSLSYNVKTSSSGVIQSNFDLLYSNGDVFFSDSSTTNPGSGGTP